MYHTVVEYENQSIPLQVLDNVGYMGTRREAQFSPLYNVNYVNEMKNACGSEA